MAIITVHVVRASQAANAQATLRQRRPNTGICATTIRVANAAQRKFNDKMADKTPPQLDLLRQIPEARAGHEQLGSKNG
jgi:hypothetical protein